MKNKEGYLYNNKYFEKETDNWKYPLNFIDFETATPAIPPFKGLSPYELIAFQYSIHTLKENGDVEHSSEFLLASAATFPNFEFLQHLARDLSLNNGSIFMWYPHERFTLEAILKQVNKLKLNNKFQNEIDFIRTILPGGDREIIDLYALSKNGVFYPNTKGSNSIKKFLLQLIILNFYKINIQSQFMATIIT